MKKIICFFIFFIIIICNTNSQNHNRFFEGYWYGLLEFQGSELILTFEIKNVNDSLIGLMNSPLQGANDIPVSKIEVLQDSIKIFIKTLGANFKGLLNEKDSLLEGVFTQAVFKIPLKLTKTQELFTLKRPQEPIPPYDYTQEDIIFENSKNGIKLAGTLTYPASEGTFPVVVLISGSGPQDRNEEILGHKPFFVIADYFAKKGLAVLRFDDRGVGKSGGSFASATSMDFSSDVEAAVSFLKKHPAVNVSQIGLIGHSEGGMIAPIIASKDKDIAFIILLAGPGISGEQVLLTQIKKILEIENNDPKFIKHVLADSKKTYQILKKYTNSKKAADAIRKYFEKRAKKIPADKHLVYGYLKPAVEMKIQSLNDPWFRYFLTFNPEDYLRNVNCPVLALYGDKDVQVLHEENIKGLEKIIKKYQKNNFEIKLYKGKNHLFQNANIGSISEYALIEETICPIVLEDLAAWIKNLKK